MVSEKPVEPEVEQPIADPKAERKEEREAEKAARKEDRAEKKEERDDERNLREHPFGILAGSDDLDDLDEPKPKRDILPNHSPVTLPVTADDLAEYTQKRVEEEVARLKAAADEAKGDRVENREEYKADVKAGHEQAKADREAAAAARKAERAGGGE